MSLTKRKIHEVDENYGYDLLESIMSLYRNLWEIDGLINVLPTIVYDAETLGDLKVAFNQLDNIIENVREIQTLKEEPQE